METYSGTRFSGCYFLLQAAAVVAWWAWMCAVPVHRSLFLPHGAAEAELLAFMAPDLIVSAAASLVASGLFFAGRSWAIPVAWLAAGSVVYAAIYCVAWAMSREGGWLSIVFMLPAALFSVIAALDASPGVAPVFRRARPAGPKQHVSMTLVQIALFWSFFLVVVPVALVALETELGWTSPRVLPGQRLVAVALFLAFSALGLASGFTMAKHGMGTPLPFRAPNRLVVAGPYAFIRNPMMIAGIGQGASVALWLGSWIVLLYVVVGSLIWQCLVRPAEERNLRAEFGAEYRRYCDEVRCWRPRLRPYSGRSP